MRFPYSGIPQSDRSSSDCITIPRVCNSVSEKNPQSFSVFDAVGGARKDRQLPSNSAFGIDLRRLRSSRELDFAHLSLLFLANPPFYIYTNAQGEGKRDKGGGARDVPRGDMRKSNCTRFEKALANPLAIRRR